MPLFNTVDKAELRKQLQDSREERITLSFYRYYHLEDPQATRDALYRQWSELGLYGRVYVAREGINAQVSIPARNLEAFRAQLQAIPWLRGVRLNQALDDDGKSFFKLIIKVRLKIVADGLDDASFDVTRRGHHLNAREVNRLIEEEGAILVDMRNHYESEVGHFEGAICPDVETFREALPLVVDLLKEDKEKPLLMYCTGGIRCEKASAYFLHQGFRQVNMIDGGIIEYARQCEREGLPNHFVGKNFVFDERLGERVSEDVIARCHQCGAPCDTHINCANVECNLLFIQCESCAEKYVECCSRKCAEYAALPGEARQALRGQVAFMGNRSGIGRFQPALQDEKLNLPPAAG